MNTEARVSFFHMAELQSVCDQGLHGLQPSRMEEGEPGLRAHARAQGQTWCSRTGASESHPREDGR